MRQAADAGSRPGPPCDVVVVGAGLTGLVCAWALKRAGLAVRVLEAAAQPGGVIASQSRDGCLLERGPNTAMDASGAMAGLILLLGLQDQVCWASAVADKRYVVRDGRLVALPGSAAGLVRTPLFSARAKWGLLAAPLRRGAAPGIEESVAAFVRRRLGPEFLDYAVDPFVAGIFAADPEQLSLRAAFPRLHALEQRWAAWPRRPAMNGVAAASESTRRGPEQPEQRQQRRKGPPRSFSFAGGMQSLTDTLAAAVGTVTLDTRVWALEPLPLGGLQVHAQQRGQALSWQAPAVVLAVPAGQAAELVRPHATDAAAALDTIHYAPIATVVSAYASGDIGHALDGFGCLLPSRERRQLLGILFSSRMFEGRAPAGTTLLTAFLGGRRNPELPGLPEAEIAAIVRAEQAALLDARAAPRWQQVTRWPRAIPQYTLGHLERVARADAAETALPGLRLCGNWKGGVSIADCVRNGQALAERLVAQLRPAR